MSHYTEDLAAIYESFEAVSNGQYTPVQGSPSYHKGMLPAAGPGGGYSAYQKNITGNGITAVIADEEENPILHKIAELMNDAEGKGMTYALLMLNDLKNFIKDELHKEED
jgi:hypothetical protein